MKKMLTLLLICCLLLVWLWTGPARSETSVTLEAGEWTWEAGGISAFSGTIIPDGDLPAAVLKLKAEAMDEDAGTVYFLTLDGKNVKIRRRGPEATVALTAGTPFSFEGQWVLPDETDGSLVYARITLTVENEQGEEIGRGILEMGSRETEKKLLEQTLTGRMNRLIRILTAACAAVWLLAAGRSLILNRKKGEKGKNGHADL